MTALYLMLVSVCLGLLVACKGDNKQTEAHEPSSEKNHNFEGGSNISFRGEELQSNSELDLRSIIESSPEIDWDFLYGKRAYFSNESNIDDSIKILLALPHSEGRSAMLAAIFLTAADDNPLRAVESATSLVGPGDNRTAILSFIFTHSESEGLAMKSIDEGYQFYSQLQTQEERNDLIHLITASLAKKSSVEEVVDLASRVTNDQFSISTIGSFLRASAFYSSDPEVRLKRKKKLDQTINRFKSEVKKGNVDKDVFRKSLHEISSKYPNKVWDIIGDDVSGMKKLSPEELGILTDVVKSNPNKMTVDLFESASSSEFVKTHALKEWTKVDIAAAGNFYVENRKQLSREQRISLDKNIAEKSLALGENDTALLWAEKIENEVIRNSMVKKITKLLE